MPDAAYQVARSVARRLVAQLQLAPPFDVDRVVKRFARVLEDEVPAPADLVTMHSAVPGDPPIVVLQAALASSPDRRRFSLAHALGHVLLGWHPLGSPCDVSAPPRELPVTVHDLVEGEANAFARELLVPAAWIESLAAFDRPAELVRHVAERAGVPVMAAARAVSLQLPPSFVWAVVDEWSRVLDAGRSPGTSIQSPQLGSELGPMFARHAAQRHRTELGACSLRMWSYDARARDHLPHDRSARQVAQAIAADLGLSPDDAEELVARVDGIAGWANERIAGASLEGMARALDERARSLPELARAATHPEFGHLVEAKATELVARRIAR